MYEASLAAERGFETLNGELARACAMLAEEDTAGRAWCRANGYAGYTSYASLNDLPTRATAFADLRRRLDRHVAAFANEVGFADRLKLDSLWVNVLDRGGAHSGHIHPHSAISGTYYVGLPEGSGGLRLEDPRLPLMMAAPRRRDDAPDGGRGFTTLIPAAGTMFLWESWLRHEVLPHRGRGQRISISFNYA